jgi:Heterokaryon incompatibility protein (HET)
LLEIEVDGCRWSVRQNLWKYLDMARQTPELHTTALWVDAICINQDNIQERNEQVSSIGEICAGAERAVVWLGSGNATLEKTIEFLDRCYTSSPDQNLTWVLENMDEEYSPAKVKVHKAFLEGLAGDRFGLLGIP